MSEGHLCVRGPQLRVPREQLCVPGDQMCVCPEKENIDFLCPEITCVCLESTSVRGEQMCVPKAHQGDA